MRASVQSPAARPMLPMEVLLISNKSTEERTHSFMDRLGGYVRVGTRPRIRRTLQFPEDEQLGRETCNGIITVLLEQRHRGDCTRVGSKRSQSTHSVQRSGRLGPDSSTPMGSFSMLVSPLGSAASPTTPGQRSHPDAWTPAGPSSWIARSPCCDGCVPDGRPWQVRPDQWLR